MSEEKYNNKYRTTSARLAGWDYGAHALYFITICTKDKVNYFGDIIKDTNKVASLQKTAIGTIAYDNWLKIPEYSPFVELDEFAIMPNHLHGILFINKPKKTDWQSNKFGSQSQNMASIMRGYKSSVTMYATINNIGFAWQSKYHDHIIRNEREYFNIKEYIRNNPEQWLLKGDIGNDVFKM